MGACGIGMGIHVVLENTYVIAFAILSKFLTSPALKMLPDARVLLALHDPAELGQLTA